MADKNDSKPEVVKTNTLPGRESHVVQASLYSGPIPPPELFMGYEKALPGLADRVMTMSESQSAHRIKIENKVVKTDSLRSVLGLVFAFCIIVIGMILGAFLVYKDKPISGFVAMITPLGIVVGAFILQRANLNLGKDKAKDKSLMEK